MGGFVRTALLVVAGYCVMIVVATTACLAVLVIGDILSNGHRPHYQLFDEVFVFDAFWAGLVVTGATAWPGFALTLAVSRWKNVRSAAYFTLCGGLTALLAVFLFSWIVLRSYGFFTGTAFNMPAVITGGLAGGFAYGLFARRFRLFQRAAITATAPAGS